MPGNLLHGRMSARLWGAILLTGSAILFAVMANLVRFAGYRGIPGEESTLVRFIFGLLTVVGMHFFGATRLVIRRTGWLTARGVTGAVAILFYFLSLSSTTGPESTPLTNSVLLSNSYFIFVPIFGAIIIRERLTLTVAAAVLVAFAGMYLVISPDFRDVAMGDVYGLLSGIMAGLAIVTVRELRRTEPAPVIFLALCAAGIIISGAMVWINGVVVPDAVGWAIFAGMAVTATAAQLLLTHAFRYIPAGEGSLIAMTTIIYASLGGIVIFHEPFTPTFAIGSTLVFASAGYLAVRYDGGQGNV